MTIIQIIALVFQFGLAIGLMGAVAITEYRDYKHHKMLDKQGKNLASMIGFLNTLDRLGFNPPHYSAHLANRYSHD